MIISASRRTDLPAFYGEWFRRRLSAGFCKVANPYNRRQRATLSLRREDVDGFVFWTKQLGPFRGVLDEVHQRGFPFIVQYTINGYPRVLESRVVQAERSVAQLRALAARFGSRAAVWRYDPIIFSTVTDRDFHLCNFRRLATQLAGATDEVVVSFLQLYAKTRRNLEQAGRQEGFAWEDPPDASKRALLAELATIASEQRLRLTLCSQPQLLIAGVTAARCVDATRLMEVAGRALRARRRGNRLGCACAESKDLGAYESCPHGCSYCYAVGRRAAALARYRDHDPAGEYLFAPEPMATAPDPAAA
ncbi:MAG: DUF1848 domain-containing protein [Proteobacteria bacterium]|nr:DUF1848 domain-containing protein [Pseudomonadota bacterium]